LIEQRLAIEDLFNYYGSSLDDDRLEDWLELFSDNCSYKIVSRENINLNLPASLMLCENKNMLVDRIVSLRKANEFNIHRRKHLISNIHIKTGSSDQGSRSDIINVVANFAVFHSDNEGNGSLYSFGSYEDKIRFVDGSPLFSEKIVIVENWTIPHMLSIPI
jgi:anthranilate 1,2-dioxygenase small subunit